MSIAADSFIQIIAHICPVALHAILSNNAFADQSAGGIVCYANINFVETSIRFSHISGRILGKQARILMHDIDDK